MTSWIERAMIWRFLPDAIGLAGLASLPAPASAAGYCPAADFAGFLAAFARDPVVQRAHTRVSLASETIAADAKPEPRTVRTMLDARRFRFPVMPGPAEQKRRHMTARSRPAAGGMKVTLRVGETDEQVRLLFAREPDCWTLVRKSDDSL